MSNNSVAILLKALILFDVLVLDPVYHLAVDRLFEWKCILVHRNANVILYAFLFSLIPIQYYYEA